jgi:PAS domain S-box-containing protein
MTQTTQGRGASPPPAPGAAGAPGADSAAGAADDPLTGAAAREGEARFRAAFDAANVGQALTDADGRYLRVNARLCAMLGYTEGELLARTVREVTHPDDWPREAALRASALAGEPSRSRFELRLVRADGSLCWADAATAALGEGAGTLKPRCLVSQLQDVTARKRAEAELAESRARLALALDAARVGVWRWDVGADVTHWSEGMAALLGVPPATASAPTARLLPLMHPDDRRPFVAGLRAALRDAADLEATFRVTGPDGAVRWLCCRGSVTRDAAGRPSRFDGVLLDVTDRRRADAAHAQEEAAREQARRLDAVGRLAGGVAHDFNNLLTVVGGHAEVARELLGADHPARADVEAIAAAAERAAALTRQLLAIGRRQRLRPAPLDVAATVCELVPTLRRLAGDRVRVSFEVERAAARPGAACALADAVPLAQVVFQLAANARDAMDDAGGTLALVVGRVTLGGARSYPAGLRGREDTAAITTGPDALPPGDYVTLVARDTGRGMDAATLGRVFEPFFTSRPFGEGAGLGLATAHGTVRQMGGAIAVESTPGAGTTFTVHLPALALPPGSAAGEERPPPHDGDGAGPGTRDAVRDEGNGAGPPRPAVLLVEDEPLVRSLIARHLRWAGYAVVPVGDGEEALARFAAEGPAAWALVVSDVVMPRIDGVELVRRLRAAAPALPAVLTSGYTADALETPGGLPPGVAFLEKPATRDELLDAVARALAEAPGGAT